MLTSKQWRSTTPGSWNSGYKGMTLLHLASALGYSKLVCTMLGWRADNPSVILETEIDALSQDVMGYTPLVILSNIFDKIVEFTLLFPHLRCGHVLGVIKKQLRFCINGTTMH